MKLRLYLVFQQIHLLLVVIESNAKYVDLTRKKNDM